MNVKGPYLLLYSITLRTLLHSLLGLYLENHKQIMPSNLTDFTVIAHIEHIHLDFYIGQ